MVSAGKNIDFPGFCVPRIYVSLQEDKNRSEQGDHYSDPWCY